MSKPAPKFPDDLSIVERVDLNSSAADRDKIFPIMSISKSFCGAVCALMAVDGEFGEKGIDATLNEVLERAKSQHANRREQIEKYQAMLREREFADVTIAELLTHRSGCCDGSAGNVIYRNRLDFFQEKLSRQGLRRGDYSYSNAGYTLVEEVINLISETGNYEQELQERILSKCGLARSGPLANSIEAQSRVAPIITLPGTEDSFGRRVEVRQERRFDQFIPFGVNPMSCMGLCSTANDLEKYSCELAKMVTGQENVFTERKELVSQIYRRATRNDKNYSLGLEFVPRDQRCVMRHDGYFPGNTSMMEVVIPCGIGVFRGDEKIKFEEGQMEVAIFLRQHDYTALEILNKSYPKMPMALLKSFVDSVMNDDERERRKLYAEWENAAYLIQENRLQEIYMKQVRPQVFEAFKTVRGLVSEFLAENYLDESGVIDSEKIGRDFRSNEDIERVFKHPKVKEALDAARKKAEELLLPSTRPQSPGAVKAQASASTSYQQ